MAVDETTRGWYTDLVLWKCSIRNNSGEMSTPLSNSLDGFQCVDDNFDRIPEPKETVVLGIKGVIRCGKECIYFYNHESFNPPPFYFEFFSEGLLHFGTSNPSYTYLSSRFTRLLGSSC